MSLVQRIMSPFARKGMNPGSPPQAKEDRIFWSGLSGLGHREFGQVPAALRAGFVISSGMGMMPIKVDGSPEIGRLLNDGPNELLTGVEFVEMMTLHAIFRGVGRAFVDRSVSTGKIRALYPLPPQWGVAEWTWNEDAQQFLLPITIPDRGTKGGYLGDFTRSDVLEVTSPRWEMVRGYDVTHACQKALGLSTQLQERQGRLSDTNAPYGILVSKDGTSTQAINKLKNEWAAQFGRSGIAVVDFEAEFTQMMQTASDQQLLETREFQIEEIARMYGVHPYMLMKTSGSGAQGAISDVMLFHQVYTMGPWVARWEAALRRSVSGGRPVNFDESTLLRTTPRERAEIDARSLGAGGNKPWKTANEVREAWGLGPHDDGVSLAFEASPPMEGGNET